MTRHPQAFPALMRAGGEASRRAYDHAPVTLGGNAMVLAAAGRRNVTGSVNITDHPQRFARVLEQVLRDPRARADLRALLDAHGLAAQPAILTPPPPRKGPPVFTLSFDTDNDAFAGDPTPEVARILREAANRTEAGRSPTARARGL